MTDQKRRNINALTYSSSILAYMEIFAICILLALSQTQTSRGLAVGGLILWLITNIIFGLYYLLVIRHDASVVQVVEQMSSKSKCIYYTTLCLSITFTLRTYRVLYCGLFRGVAPYLMKPQRE